MAEDNNLHGALPHFEEAARLMPDNDRVRYNWAISRQKLKRPTEAEAAYKSALRLAPDNPDYNYGISTLYLQKNRFKEALPHVEKLIR